MHYIDENNTNASNQITFICIHGNPTSSYLWRNIIPYLKTKGRVIAVDLIGFGKSDKPDIDYTLSSHFKYVNDFINTLKLDNIVFVMHDWGVAFGLTYARKNPAKIKGLIFMEGVIKPMIWNEFAFQPVRAIFRLFRTPVIGRFMNINLNMFVHKILLDMGSMRELSNVEKEYYSKPFLIKKNRIPIYLFPTFIPINKKPQSTYKMVYKNHKWLQTTKIPKLIFWVTPGALVKPKMIIDFRNEYPNLSDKYLGESAHFIQEDFPHEIGSEIIKWYQNLNHEKS